MFIMWTRTTTMKVAETGGRLIMGCDLALFQIKNFQAQGVSWMIWKQPRLHPDFNSGAPSAPKRGIHGIILPWIAGRLTWLHRKCPSDSNPHSRTHYIQISIKKQSNSSMNHIFFRYGRSFMFCFLMIQKRLMIQIFYT